MNLVLTYHAQIRLFERGISIEKIRKCLKEPDSVEVDRKDISKLRFIKGIGDENLLVVANKMGNTYIIITSYYI